ncbi:ATP-binding cassette domain-containing protein [bacterium]|nr:ATP-binding cassette domain-containing protein [bacterium]
MELIMRNVIEIKGLNYKYPNGVQALKDLNLSVKEGSKIGLIGPNGAGKTTFLLHLNGIISLDPTLTILGMQMKKKNVNSIRRQLGIVFQDPDDQLFSTTVFDDIAYGPLNMGLAKEEVIERTNKALSQVEMLKFSGHSPHHLSFGEKKRAAIATILSMEPEIMVLDEPSSNLDPKHRRQLIEILRSIDKTMIIASHDLEMIYELCDDTVLLNGGRIVTSGKTADILSNEELMLQNCLEVPLTLKYQ